MSKPNNLGLMEDQLERWNIRFRYVRPFTPGCVLRVVAKKRTFRRAVAFVAA